MWTDAKVNVDRSGADVDCGKSNVDDAGGNVDGMSGKVNKTGGNVKCAGRNVKWSGRIMNGFDGNMSTLGAIVGASEGNVVGCRANGGKLKSIV